jgi:hypothetical protein
MTADDPNSYRISMSADVPSTTACFFPASPRIRRISAPSAARFPQRPTTFFLEGDGELLCCIHPSRTAGAAAAADEVIE